MKKLVAGLALALVGLAAPAHAADRALDAQKNLQRLVGSWKGSGSVTLPDGKVLNMKTTYDCKKAGGGLAVACHFTASAPGMPLIESNDLFGYSAGDGLVHWFTVTSSGDVHDHKGGFDETGTLTAIHEGPQDGKLYQEQVSLQLISDTKVRVRCSVKVGAQQMESTDMTVTKG